MDYKALGYKAGLEGKPSLPPSLAWYPRVAYENGYNDGRAERLKGQENG